MSHELRIDFTLDTICPFTYLGRRRLQIAMKLAEEAGMPVTFKVVYHPFDIAKKLSRTGQSKMKWYLEKNGNNVEQNQKMIDAMKSMGKEIGIDFSYGGEVCNTLNAHRVIMKVQEGKLGDVEKLIDSLYLQYFEQERNPASRETLIAACRAADVADMSAIESLLETDELESEVKSAIVEQNMNGYDGVPAVIFEGKRRDFSLIGAKPPMQYLNTISQVLKELR